MPEHTCAACGHTERHELETYIPDDPGEVIEPKEIRFNFRKVGLIWGSEAQEGAELLAR